MEEVKAHRTKSDAWTILRGKVRGNKGLIAVTTVLVHELSNSLVQDICWPKINLNVVPMQVYNITPYINFHPGGADWIMKGAGMDSTALFNKYHAWVNSDMLLEKCLIGQLAPAAAN